MSAVRQSTDLDLPLFLGRWRRPKCLSGLSIAGIDIRYVQTLLGHSKLDTTARYTRVATRRIAAKEWRSECRLTSSVMPAAFAV